MMVTSQLVVFLLFGHMVYDKHQERELNKLVSKQEKDHCQNHKVFLGKEGQYSLS